MSNKELAKGIHWVGAIDWDVRDFHGYSTLAGTTYNAFLIIDEKITLIDTVKRSHYEDMMHQIREIIDPEKIDYLIINHVELDHAGALAEVMEAVKPEKLICSPMGEKSHSRAFPPAGLAFRGGKNRRAAQHRQTYLLFPRNQDAALA